MTVVTTLFPALCFLISIAFSEVTKLPHIRGWSTPGIYGAPQVRGTKVVLIRAQLWYQNYARQPGEARNPDREYLSKNFTAVVDICSLPAALRRPQFPCCRHTAM